MSGFVLYFFLSILWAQECDSLREELSKEGADVPALFLELHACDPKIAQKYASKALSGYQFDQSNEKHPDFIRKILHLRAYDAMSRWLNSLVLKERNRVLIQIGEDCVDDAVVRDFFLRQEIKNRSDFWLNRWDIALRACPDPEIVQLLRSRITKGKKQGLSRFLGILTSYAIVERENSLPLVVKQIEMATPSQRIRYFDIFTHMMIAAESEDESTVLLEQIKKSIFALSILSNEDVADRARQFFLQFGDLSAANAMARYRYHKALQDDYALIWGGIIVESVICANNIPRQNIHEILLIDIEANKWQEDIDLQLHKHFSGWKESLVKECKGKGRNRLTVSERPFVTEQKFEEWLEIQKKKAYEFEVADEFRKEIRHQPLGLE